LTPTGGRHANRRPVEQLVRDAGATPFEARGREHNHELEAMAAVIIRLLFAGADPLSASD
jgi:hypothetical protein